ncbi:MAG: hypothetical protein ACJ75J_08300 [Cytophagaceae bacterium]
MKHFNLSQEEISIMKILSRKKIMPYLLGFLLSALVIFIVFIQVSKNYSLGYFSAGSFLIIISLITLSLFLLHFIYTSGVVQAILKRNQKIIYTGILTEKKIKDKSSSKRYVFYMDGMKFSVNQQDFESYQTGEKVEFHVSLNGKHLIKISRPSA